MNKILSKNRLTDQVFSIEVEAPLIARSYKAGNFVIIRVEDKSQRLPLTVTKVNPERGSVTVVVKASNPSNARLAKLSAPDAPFPPMNAAPAAPVDFAATDEKDDLPF